MLNRAAFLDTRFKALNFLEQCEKDEVFRMITDEATLINNDEESEEPPSKRAREEHKLLQLLENVVKPTVESQHKISTVEKINVEILKYMYMYIVYVAEEQTTEEAFW